MSKPPKKKHFHSFEIDNLMQDFSKAKLDHVPDGGRVQQINTYLNM